MQYMKLIFSGGTNYFFSEFGQGVHRQCLSMQGDAAIAAWECSQQTWKHLLAVAIVRHMAMEMSEWAKAELLGKRASRRHQVW